MSQQPRQAEAQQASEAFQTALTLIGLSTIEEALDLFDDVNPAKAASTGARWLTRAVELVMSRRSLSRQLAWAYYRLARALYTGSTVPDPYQPEKKNPTLGDVRREFRLVIASVQATTAKADSEQAQRTVDRLADGEAGTDPLTISLPLPREGDDLVLKLDTIEQLLDLEDELDQLAREETITNLEALGAKGIERRLERGPKSLTPEAAHSESAARQAAAAARIAMNGGRGTLWSVSSQDRRVIGYARVSRTGTPCGFCAMLLSRGFTERSGLYTSSKAGGGENASDGANYEDGDLYHDNCHCYAEPIYSREQYLNDPRFDLNREYAELWPRVTKGYGGKDALNVWRRFIRKRNRTDALEAAAGAA